MAIADPVYLGMAAKYSVPGTPEYHPEAAVWDDPLEHQRLMLRLDAEFTDGWAYCLQAPALRTLLPLAPEGVRVCAWVKPWATWRPGAGPAHAWEPVIVRCGKRKVVDRRPRDWVAASVGHKHTDPFFGAKPPEFSRWIFDIFALGEHPDDELVDLFPGSGAVTRAWQEFMAKHQQVRGRRDVMQTSLFDMTTESTDSTSPVVPMVGSGCDVASEVGTNGPSQAAPPLAEVTSGGAVPPDAFTGGST